MLKKINICKCLWIVAYYCCIYSDYPQAMSASARSSRISALENMLFSSAVLWSRWPQVHEAEKPERLFNGKARWHYVKSLPAEAEHNELPFSVSIFCKVCNNLGFRCILWWILCMHIHGLWILVLWLLLGLRSWGSDCWRATVPRCYSTVGTVHEMAAARAREWRLGFWAPGTPATGLRPWPARGKGFPSNLFLD